MILPLDFGRLSSGVHSEQHALIAKQHHCIEGVLRGYRVQYYESIVHNLLLAGLEGDCAVDLMDRIVMLDHPFNSFFRSE